VVGCLWDSRDKPGPHGGGRHFPFTLFVIVPAPKKTERLASVVPCCGWLWGQMERVLPDLKGAPDRDRCEQLAKEVPPFADTTAGANPDPLSAADQARLAGCLTSMLPGDGSSGGLWPVLDLQAREFREGRGNSAAWRLPIIESMGVLGQVDNWTRWLDNSLSGYPGEFGLFLPTDAAVRPSYLGLLLRQVRPEDFAVFSGDPVHVEHVLGKCPQSQAVMA
jgi:hypothetical protein